MVRLKRIFTSGEYIIISMVVCGIILLFAYSEFTVHMQNLL